MPNTRRQTITESVDSCSLLKYTMCNVRRSLTVSSILFSDAIQRSAVSLSNLLFSVLELTLASYIIIADMMWL